MSTLYFPTINQGGAAGAALLDRGVAWPSGPGLGIPWQIDVDVAYWLERFRDADGHLPPWYDWHYVTGGATYQRMIYKTVPNIGVIERLIRRDPSHLWLVMNEPERHDQANLSPEQGAVVAQEMRDLGACIAVPGVIIGEDGLAWLDAYLAAGRPLPEAWHVHLYHADSAKQVDERLGLWDDWMAERSLVRPTIISEYNGNWSDVETEIVVMQHMAQRGAALDWLIAWYWFSLRFEVDRGGAGGNDLITLDGELTPAGEAFENIRQSWSSSNSKIGPKS